MKISGKIQLPGDKSISHRAIMLASISKGESNIYNLPNSKDILSTINCLQLCGIKIKSNTDFTRVVGGTLKKPEKKLNCNNSGTTARLLTGLLGGQNISACFYGDESLSGRPMDRVIEPLKEMGINIKSNNNKLPFEIIDIALKLYISSKSFKLKFFLGAHETNNTKNIKISLFINYYFLTTNL